MIAKPNCKKKEPHKCLDKFYLLIKFGNKSDSGKGVHNISHLIEKELQACDCCGGLWFHSR